MIPYASYARFTSAISLFRTVSRRRSDATAVSSALGDTHPELEAGQRGEGCWGNRLCVLVAVMDGE